MFFASLLPNVCSIFPDYNVSKHRSSKDEGGSNEEDDETTIRGLSFCAISHSLAQIASPQPPIEQNIKQRSASVPAILFGAHALMLKARDGLLQEAVKPGDCA